MLEEYLLKKKLFLNNIIQKSMKKKLIIIAAGFLLSYPAAVLSNSINLSTNTFEDKIQKNIGEKNPQNIINNADIQLR